MQLFLQVGKYLKRIAGVVSNYPSLLADNNEALDGKGAVAATCKLLHQHHVLEEGPALFNGLKPVDIVSIEVELVFGIEAFMHLHSFSLNSKPVVLLK